ncbi:O-methyltransferase [Larkinella sp. VNQ87]|uniref:O-methyltransferase n=1 Tax=Larkinella sp. VNQ87 TaxID=3400921 RepID=UPI003C04CC25
MDERFKEFLDELYESGQQNDLQATAKRDKLLNITPDTGTFLSLLVKATEARAILEIGTSNGYSTLWLAEAVQRTGGRVTTVELNPAKAELARANFEKIGLSLFIDLVVSDAETFLQTTQPHSFDFIFWDADRTQYVSHWRSVNASLKPGGLVVVDNAVSHRQELAPFQKLLEETPGFSTALVPVGKGELLIWKEKLPIDG